MKKRKKSNLSLMLIALILVVSVGYALLTQQLKIDGISIINKATWKIYWDNVDVNENSVSGDAVTQAAEITNEEKTLVEYSITLSKPRDFYEFTVDAVNEGTIDAMVNVVSNKVYEENGTTERELPSYLTYKVTYGDNIEIDKNHLLKAGEFETYKVRVEFKDIDDPEELPQADETLKFKFSVDYIQADDQATERETNYPFTTTISSDSLVLMSYDIDYDKCVEEFNGKLPTSINVESFCRGEDVTYQGQNVNFKMYAHYYRSEYEKKGIITNAKYGEVESFEIDYEGCKNYLLQDGDIEEEQVELFCTGNTATVFGEEENLIDMLESNPEYIGEYVALGIVDADFIETEPYKIITGYDGKIPKKLVIPREINGVKVVGIAEGAFMNKGIESVTIPDTVTSVGMNAFYKNNLNKVEIKGTKTKVGFCAFGIADNINKHNLPSDYACQDICSFTLNNKTFNYENGMSWAEWIDSSYNTDYAFELSNISTYHAKIDTNEISRVTYLDDYYWRLINGETKIKCWDSYIASNAFLYSKADYQMVPKDALIYKDGTYETRIRTHVAC